MEKRLSDFMGRVIDCFKVGAAQVAISQRCIGTMKFSCAKSMTNHVGPKGMQGEAIIDEHLRQMEPGVLLFC